MPASPGSRPGRHAPPGEVICRCHRSRSGQNRPMHPVSLLRHLILLWFLALPLLVSAGTPSPLQRAEEVPLGALPDGTPISQFTLRNRHGLVVQLISYGATLTSIQVPDREGHFTSVIRGASGLTPYLTGFNAPAPVIGRV
ncbi:MAG TPA: hypothetical protein DCM86_19555, partial [Verrucomicrobiales bacterium]|nr:hypothetical protein [Verrucomicrobiales bacterium]